MGFEKRESSRSALIRVAWEVLDEDEEESSLVLKAFSIRCSYHCLSTPSTGKTPANAPHSVVMFEIASLSSTESVSTPEPVNSMTELRTSSLLKVPQSATMTSFPVTPGGSWLRRDTLTIGGICHQVWPVAQIAAASVLEEDDRRTKGIRLKGGEARGRRDGDAEDQLHRTEAN
jgi:hypothetical protein